MSDGWSGESAGGREAVSKPPIGRRAAPRRGLARAQPRPEQREADRRGGRSGRRARRRTAHQPGEGQGRGRGGELAARFGETFDQHRTKPPPPRRFALRPDRRSTRSAPEAGQGARAGKKAQGRPNGGGPPAGRTGPSQSQN